MTLCTRCKTRDAGTLANGDPRTLCGPCVFEMIDNTVAWGGETDEEKAVIARYKQAMVDLAEAFNG